MPIGEAVFCAGVFLISTQQEAFHGTYRYMVPLVPLTLAIARGPPQGAPLDHRAQSGVRRPDAAGIRHAQPAHGLNRLLKIAACLVQVDSVEVVRTEPELRP